MAKSISVMIAEEREMDNDIERTPELCERGDQIKKTSESLQVSHLLKLGRREKLVLFFAKGVDLSK